MSSAKDENPYGGGGGGTVRPKTKFQVAAMAVGSAAANEKAMASHEGKSGNPESTATEFEKDEWTKLAYNATIAAIAAKNQRVTANEKLFSRTVLGTYTWEVWSPPPRSSVRGKVVPRVMNQHKSRRLCSMEIHRVTPVALNGIPEPGTQSKNGAENSAPGTHSYQECIIRVLVPATKELNRKFRNEALKNIIHTGSARSSALTHVGSTRDVFKTTENGYDYDDETLHSSSNVNEEQSRYEQLADHGGKHYDGWKPKYSFPLGGLYIKSKHKKTVDILISVDDFKQDRELIFDNLADAKDFTKTVERQKRLETQRQEERLKVALGGRIVLPKFEVVTFLFEIAAGYGLPVGDYTSSDPYVVAYLGHQEIHRTEYISKTLNPIWTLKTGSLFLLQVDSKRFFIEEGITFVVRDYDKLGKHDVIALCQVDPKILYDADGERMEFKLSLPSSGGRSAPKEENAGILVIRCRRATKYDQKFMEEYNKHDTKNAKGVASYNAPVADTNVIKTITTKVKKVDKGTGDTLHKIRPGPDPTRPPKETEWMSESDLEVEVLKPSLHWVDMGEGTLGKVYLEILACDGLPNMDRGGFYGNKTDAFVACVYEDVYGRTDVIDDCLSPRWPPWSNRAFILNMYHPSSYINIAVFDYDAGGARIADHDLIGRVSVDLTNLRSSTEYVLSYNLCATARLASRTSLGKIMIRLRIEINDERQLVLATLRPPEPVYVNTKSRKDFNVIRETCFGSIDENRYSSTTLKSYIDELFELQHVLFYLEDAVMTVLLWRGHFDITLPLVGKSIVLPVHSMMAFLTAVVLVENPILFPSFWFGSLAWLLIAIGGWRRSSENVWFRCHSYAQILKMLFLGDDYALPHRIQPFENFEKAQVEAENWVNRIEESAARATRAAEEANASEAERQKELAEIGEADTDLGTKVGEGGLGIDPVRAALYPIQLMLGIFVCSVRFTKHVFTWQEAYFSFWITTCSLVLSVLCLFVPWFWCIKWGSRIFAWTIFGPWMKLLDIYYFSLIKPETEEERQRREEMEKLKQKMVTAEAVFETRILREDAAKTKAMKQYMFGRYALRIPILKQDRYIDMPLAESFATPYKEKDFTLAQLAMQEAGKNRTRIPGQTLVGDMIPSVMENNFTLAPTGKAALHTEKLSKHAPGARGRMANKFRIIAAVIAAIAITYVGTPMIASFLSKGEKWITSEL
eukprot:CAMPEP_0172372246 /NCGR_PEP_ID=MMETSP1060-20121228/46652_1 /TAXON_ID=37318 /ORGANISM="Pseudo-nitzschia pungens, Strain cf. cingulata" /LENGTH=1198 /DNA_ID=CAMNT_0013098153 /DNA_START=437 /DNA_END=4033 /DNA_ORIENTATION=+